LNNHSNTSVDEGTLSSVFLPITRDWEWGEKSDRPAFMVEDSRLIMVNRQTRIPLAKIEFTGPLNPEDVELIFNDNILIVYLDDSNQFFAFQKK
jgi:hypothetical protein